MKLDTKYLITTDNWFTAPDGMQYRNVFGTVHGIYSLTLVDRIERWHQ